MLAALGGFLCLLALVFISVKSDTICVKMIASKKEETQKREVLRNTLRQIATGVSEEDFREKRTNNALLALGISGIIAIATDAAVRLKLNSTADIKDWLMIGGVALTATFATAAIMRKRRTLRTNQFASLKRGETMEDAESERRLAILIRKKIDNKINNPIRSGKEERVEAKTNLLFQ